MIEEEEDLEELGEDEPEQEQECMNISSGS